VRERPLTCLLGSHWCAGNLSPRLESLPHFLSVERGREQVPSGTDVGGDRPVGGQEALRVARRVEPLHAPLPLAGRLVGVFRPVVQLPGLPMLNAGQHLAPGRAIARQLIRDDDPWDIRQSLEQLAKELLGCLLVAPTLPDNVEDLPCLIHGPPQVMAFALDDQKDLIPVPLVPRSGAPTPQLIGIGLPERPAPIAHSFVRQQDATCRHRRFAIPIAQANPEVEPDAVTDDLRREPMTLVAVGWRWWIHAASMPCGVRTIQVGRLI
jgi:hypothetical protein